VSPATTLSERSGPGRSYPVTGELPSGALAWVVCQQTGSRVANTRVWDKISYRHWVSDHDVATPAGPASANPPPAADTPPTEAMVMSFTQLYPNCLPLCCGAG
jgi:hypothetical protein